MPNLTLDMSELEFMQEHYSFGPQIVDSVAVEATKALQQGGRIVVERRYEHAPADQLVTISSVEEFNRFWASLFSNLEG
jgi:hypothetical protein